MHRSDEPVWDDDYIPDPGEPSGACEICGCKLENGMDFVCQGCADECRRLVEEEEELDARLGRL